MDHGAPRPVPGYPDHPDHPGHTMPMPGHNSDAATCSMNMLFTWSTENLCIVFPAWRVTGPASLALSLLAVAALTAGYEAVRDAARRFDARADAAAARQGEGEAGLLLGHLVAPPAMEAQRSRRGARAAFYAVQVSYSFFIMLLFMTYNGWIMLAVAVGAFVGHLAFAPASEGAAKTVACH